MIRVTVYWELSTKRFRVKICFQRGLIGIFIKDTCILVASKRFYFKNNVDMQTHVRVNENDDVVKFFTSSIISVLFVNRRQF